MISSIEAAGRHLVALEHGVEDIEEVGRLELVGRHVDGESEGLVGPPGFPAPADQVGTGRIQDPLAHGNDQARLLGERDELGGRDQSFGGVFPADGRLGADEPRVAEGHHRLVVQAELPLGDGPLERRPTLQPGDDSPAQRGPATQGVRDAVFEQQPVRKTGEPVVERLMIAQGPLAVRLHTLDAGHADQAAEDQQEQHSSRGADDGRVGVGRTRQAPPDQQPDGAIEALWVIGDREGAAAFYPLVKELMETTGVMLHTVQRPAPPRGASRPSTSNPAINDRTAANTSPSGSTQRHRRGTW